MSRYCYISLPNVPDVVYLPPQPTAQAIVDLKDLQGQWEPPAALPPSPPSTPPPATLDNLLGLWGIRSYTQGTVEACEYQGTTLPGSEHGNMLGLWEPLLNTEHGSPGRLQHVRIGGKEEVQSVKNTDIPAHNAVQPEPAAYVSFVAMSAADGTPGQPAQSSSNVRPHTAANATAGGAEST